MTIRKVVAIVFVILALLSPFFEFMNSHVVFSPDWPFRLMLVLLVLYFLKAVSDIHECRCRMEKRIEALERETESWNRGIQLTPSE